MEPNTVMVNEPSRLSRSVAHFLKFMELLTANDSDFLYDFDPTNAASLIFVIILVPLSQLERKSTGERTPLEPPRLAPQRVPRRVKFRSDSRHVGIEPEDFPQISAK